MRLQSQTSHSEFLWFFLFIQPTSILNIVTPHIRNSSWCGNMFILQNTHELSTSDINITCKAFNSKVDKVKAKRCVCIWKAKLWKMLVRGTINYDCLGFAILESRLFRLLTTNWNAVWSGVTSTRAPSSNLQGKWNPPIDCSDFLGNKRPLANKIYL